MSHHSFSANSYAYSSLQSSYGGGGSSYGGGRGSPLNIEVRFPKLTRNWTYLGFAIFAGAVAAPLVGAFIGGVCDLVIGTPLINHPFGIGEAAGLQRLGVGAAMGLSFSTISTVTYGLTSVLATSAVAIYNQIEKKIVKYKEHKIDEANYRANLQSAKSPKDFELWKNNHVFITKVKPNHSTTPNLNITNSVLDKIKKFREEVINEDTTMFIDDKNDIKETSKFKNKNT